MGRVTRQKQLEYNVDSTNYNLRITEKDKQIIKDVNMYNNNQFYQDKYPNLQETIYASNIYPNINEEPYPNINDQNYNSYNQQSHDQYYQVNQNLGFNPYQVEPSAPPEY